MFKKYNKIKKLYIMNKFKLHKKLLKYKEKHHHNNQIHKK